MKLRTGQSIAAVSSAGLLLLFALAPRFASGEEPSPFGAVLDAALAVIRPEALHAEMRFLSDDLLEGRGTATRGHQIAANFLATQFEQMGLTPAGDTGSYFQSVPLRRGRPDLQGSSVVLIRAGKPWTLTPLVDFVPAVDFGRADTRVEAPVVFAGDGVSAPELGYDDYRGLEVRGKIVALLSQAPPQFESSLRAHYSSIDVKAANAIAHGAVGLLSLSDPIQEHVYSFKEMVRDLSFPQFQWLDAQGRPNEEFPELKGTTLLGMGATAKLFEGSGHTVAEVYAAMNAGKSLAFPLPITAKIRVATKLESVTSPNVAAKLEGSDPALKNEYLVYTAHFDHLGVGEPVQGDRIYNGALDNASGTACLVEIARAFSSMNPRPRRSILFLGVTGEEAGLLGSDYFAHFPTVPKPAIVANVNMDEDLMLWPLEDVVVYGVEHSTLSREVHLAAERFHLEVSPDSQPEQVSFIRSDQYSFVKQGVPAVGPSAGLKSGNRKYNAEQIEARWEEKTYHQPSDDMNQPLLFEEGAKFARFNFLLGYLVAQRTERPTWNPGDFFGEHNAPPSR